ncbi:hypothetical protein [Sphingomonas sp. ERG5]|uniref:hypothetical protein n=1 Tax=Sphingomonas sp. ERG5 TaxID=1381597 RepID=UPI00126A7522|nr:hypothetical protein [Sphingomonas sp. ERG5]
MTKKTIIRYSLFLALALLGGCSDSDVSSLEIVNNSTRSIKNVYVNNQGRKWILGNINPGNTAKFSERLNGEGSASVFWTENNKEYSSSLCYFSKNFPAKGKMLIANGKAEYQCGNDIS